MTAPILAPLANGPSGLSTQSAPSLDSDAGSTPFAEMVAQPQAETAQGQGKSDAKNAQGSTSSESDAQDAPGKFAQEETDPAADDVDQQGLAAAGHSLPLAPATHATEGSVPGAAPGADAAQAGGGRSAEGAITPRTPATTDVASSDRGNLDDEALTRDPRALFGESARGTGRTTNELALRSSDTRAAPRRESALALFDASPLDGGTLSTDAVSRAARTEELGLTLAERLATPTGSTTLASTASSTQATLTPVTSVLGAAEGITGLGPTSSSATMGSASFELTQPFATEAWQDELGGRLQWMADSKLGRAELRLNPAGLGPLEVSLSVQGEEVTASFQAQHAATREAVEQALPRLREMLAQSGLQLADANVGQQHSEAGTNEGDSHRGRSEAGGGAVKASLDAPLNSPVPASAIRGAVDLYA
ncbi:MAG: flagellar hook-length control protein FliK [Pseudomonadota bacterium]